MTSIKLSFLVFSIIISINYAASDKQNPIIVINQGIIEKDNFLPISIYWYIRNFIEGDQFLIRISNSKKNYTEYLPIGSHTGLYESPHAALEHDESIDHYCVTVFPREGTSINVNNISCESKVQWMYDRRYSWKYFSLSDLVIPGTHHSGAYAKTDYESLKEQDITSRWTLCQTKSIKSQLMDGIRYLDLRPSLLDKNGVKKYIITHQFIDLVSMDEVVKQINEFMDISKDIVIVSFKEFWKGFEYEDDHQNFIKYLECSFERHAHPRTNWRQSLGRFWESDKRLILSYDHPLYETSDLMWRPIIQCWSNAQTIHKLHSGIADFYGYLTLPLSMPHAVMIELTHSFTTITQDLFQRDMSLRHWAQRVGRYIPRWYIEEWADKASIIAVDFYQTSGIVDLAIQLTEERLRQWHAPIRNRQ